MARRKQLGEILNLRLDAALAREVARIASAKEKTASEVARELMAHGVQVERQLEMQRLSQHYAATHDRPGVIEIEARWRPATEEELRDAGYAE